MNRPVRIVILGGGFAGTNVALRLERSFRRDPSVEITLIDAENFFTFTPLLPEVPSGSIQPKHIVFPLRALLRRTRVMQAELLSIDVAQREVVARHAAGAIARALLSITWSSRLVRWPILVVCRASPSTRWRSRAWPMPRLCTPT